jgi:hypothetical protein
MAAKAGIAARIHRLHPRFATAASGRIAQPCRVKFVKATLIFPAAFYASQFDA